MSGLVHQLVNKIVQRLYSGLHITTQLNSGLEKKKRFRPIWKDELHKAKPREVSKTKGTVEKNRRADIWLTGAVSAFLIISRCLSIQTGIAENIGQPDRNKLSTVYNKRLKGTVSV